MTIQHHYIRVWLTDAGALALDDQQRSMIRAAMASLNLPWDGGQPAELFQARLSLDGTQAIYEVTYDDAVTPAQAFAQVAQALGMDATQLQAIIGYEIYAGTCEDSAAQARAHIAANLSAWEPEGA